MNVQVIDSEGVWYINRSQFRHVDPETGIIYEPGKPTRVKPTDWLKSQPMMQTVNDPFTDAPPPALTGEKILRENPDNVAGNLNATGAAAAAPAASGGKQK